MTSQYSVIIPLASKDYNKLPYVLNSLKNHLIPQPTKYIVIYEQSELDIQQYILPNTIYIEEKQILNFKKETQHFRRPGWIYQQFLKLFNFLDDLYLIVDSDLIVNRTLNIFHEDNKPFFFLGIDQYFYPYFNYSIEVFGIKKNYNYSFISEIMLMKKSVCIELLKLFAQKNKLIFDNINDLVKLLYEFTCENCHQNFLPGDYEIYGNFIQQYDPKSYHIKKLKANLNGNYKLWTNQDIQKEIDRMSTLDYDTFTIHTWI